MSWYGHDFRINTAILYGENTDDRWLRTLEGSVMRTRRFGEDQIQ